MRAVFLDRDGVLVVPEFRDGRSYAPRTLQAYGFYPEAKGALEALKAAGYLLIVVSNQPDVGAGLISREIMRAMTNRLFHELPVDAVKICFHTRADECGCRKPLPGMLFAAANEYGIDLAASYMIGDRSSDVAAGRAAGCKTVFIDLGYTAEEKPDRADHVVGSVAQAADCILIEAVHNERVCLK